MNPQSIALTISGGQPRVDSRLLAEGFGIDHHSLKQTIRNHASTLGHLECAYVEAGPNAGKVEAYFLTEEQFLILSMVCRLTAEVLPFRVGIARAFLAMRDQLSGNTGQFTIPTNLADALQLASDTERARMALAAKVEADAPKVAFADAVQVAGQTWSFRQVCKLLKPKPKERQFKAWLQTTGWLTLAGDATSERLTSGDMVLIETERMHGGVPYRDANGKGRMDVTSHWTGQGKVKVIAAWARRHGVDVAS